MDKDKLYNVNRFNKGIVYNRPLGVDSSYTDSSYPLFDQDNFLFRNQSTPAVNYLNNHGGINIDYPALSTNSFINQNPQYIDTADAENGQRILDEKAAARNAKWQQAGQMAGMAASAIPRKYWDTLDPMYYTGSNKGYKSDIGDGLQEMGVNTTKGALASGNWWGALAGAGMKVAGDITNALWGSKINNAFVNKVKTNTAMNNMAAKEFAGVRTNASFMDAARNTNLGLTDFGKSAVGSDAIWGNKANKTYNDIHPAFQASVNNVRHGMETGARQATKIQHNNTMKHFSAYGGPLFDFDNDMGAVNYGFMQDYLASKNMQNANKNKISGITPTISTFAIGGDLQTHGTDWSTGLTRVDKGGTHEENPYEGVQMGVDPQGVPNLVEEGEAIFNDYVYSNRIQPDVKALMRMHFSKKLKKSYAEIARALEKEVSERPNDPISKAAFKRNMEMLAEEQERQKQEIEAQEAQEQFASMSPEEQIALMQQVQGQQEQGAQEQAMQEQAIAEQQGMMPPEAQMAGIPQQEITTPQEMSQPPLVAAEGGPLNNKFVKGGPKNPGYFKEEGKNYWGEFTKPGLIAFIDHIEELLKGAKTEEEKQAIREAAIKQFNEIQTGYRGIYQPLKKGEKIDYNENVKTHQQKFNDAYGNTGFYKKDENGGITNLIVDAIDVPKGGNYEDIPDKWADGYWGPRTSLRHFGSTVVGDEKYYEDLAKRFADLGLVYSPNKEWGYGDTEKPDYLYGLSMPEKKAEEKPKAGEPKIIHQVRGRDDDMLPMDPKDWVGVGKEVERRTLDDGTIVVIHEEQPNAPAEEETEEEVNDKIAPKLKNENYRYAGLFGPLAGLALWSMGVGKPKYQDLERAQEIARRGWGLANYEPIGNYQRYQPMDFWSAYNAAGANARATDRAIQNSAAPLAMKQAAMVGNNYSQQLNAGELFRKGHEYNDALDKQVFEANRGTDQFNANAFNQTSQTNAQLRNQFNQFYANMLNQNYRTRAEQDANWYNALYGNMNSLFKGVSDLGRENAQHNMIAKLAADGVFGSATPDTNTFDEYLMWKADQKRRGGK